MIVAITSDSERRGSSLQAASWLAMTVYVLTATCIVIAGNYVLPPIWFANAVITFGLLRAQRRSWPLILGICGAAEALARFTAGEGIVYAVGLPMFDVLESVLIALPMRLMGLDRDFPQPRSMLPFFLVTLCGPIASSLLTVLYLNLLAGEEFGSNALLWLGAKALAETLVLPLLMTVQWSALKEMFGRSQIAGTALYLGVFALIVGLNEWFVTYPFAFFFFPAVVLLTFQRGFAGGAIGTLAAGIYMMSLVLLGYAGSGIKEHTVASQVEIIQGFALVLGFSVILVGAALDRRRRLERGLAEAHEAALVARDAAEGASRAKSMFLANMSHELRTPLNAVIGFSELMHSEIYGPLGNQRYREYAAQIQEAGRHLLDLIGDILDMSKIEAGKYDMAREDVPADALIRDCLEMLREQATQGGVKLSANFEGYQTVRADRRALKQILLNLLSNAIKFTPAGGSVLVRSHAAKEKYVLSITDTGMGIPAEELARLGNPFVQLRSTAGISHQGTGLGLALVRGLAEMHDGTMRIESQDGKGTTVTIEIPQEQRARLAA